MQTKKIPVIPEIFYRESQLLETPDIARLLLSDSDGRNFGGDTVKIYFPEFSMQQR